MSDHGELGPLDVQMSKKDELWETQSGLTVMASLATLDDKAFLAFEKFLLQTKARSGGAITMRTAAEIATKLATGLYSPLYNQIDPLLVGEAGRGMSIADHYGKRLVTANRNATPEALEFLVSSYPSHGFVIDRHEASILFVNVREPSLLEAVLAEKIGDRARWPAPFSGDATIEFLSSEPEEVASDAATASERDEGDTHEQPESASRAEPGAAAADAGKQPASGDRRHSAANVTRIAKNN